MKKDTGEALVCSIRPNNTALVCASAEGQDQGQVTATCSPYEPSQSGWQEPVNEVSMTCKLTLRVSFFFDGTGNNRDIDEPLLTNSNVARLFRSHPLSDASTGTYAFYIPGVGTPFADIGDPGGKMGLGFGAGGAKRLEWAFKQLKDVIAAHMPRSSIKELQVNVFGFSRGATEARAFANKVYKAAEKQRAGWVWKEANIPLRFRFLGLFDTVASVGDVPTASLLDSVQVLTASADKKWSVLHENLQERRSGQDGAETGLKDLAFGEVGVDPTGPGFMDGHLSWGGDIVIPPLVEKCVHFVAMHEQRNSFPCDSVREGNQYPTNCEEYVYPGMHSDVGGGYAPGAQGRGMDDTLKLSQVALLKMHSAAIDGGVSLHQIDDIQASYQPYFKISPKSLDLFNHYMNTAGWGGLPLGKMVLAHSRYWYQWRFRRLHHLLDNGEDTLARQPQIEQAEKGFDVERQKAEAAYQQVHQRQRAVMRKVLDTQIAYQNANWMNRLDARRAHVNAVEEAQDVSMQTAQAKARLDSVPSSNATQSIQFYDRILLDGVQLLAAMAKKQTLPLTPHYQMILTAWQDELAGNGLKDDKVIAFFDNYMHDSLAGFAKDLTLPSDPRVLYNGDDNKVKYATSDQPAHKEELFG